MSLSFLPLLAEPYTEAVQSLIGLWHALAAGTPISFILIPLLLVSLVSSVALHIVREKYEHEPFQVQCCFRSICFTSQLQRSPRDRGSSRASRCSRIVLLGIFLGFHFHSQRFPSLAAFCALEQRSEYGLVLAIGLFLHSVGDAGMDPIPASRDP